MSGLVSLSSQDIELLETIGLAVPAMLSDESMAEALAQAEAIAEDMTFPLVRDITRQSLANLRSSLNLSSLPTQTYRSN